MLIGGLSLNAALPLKTTVVDIPSIRLQLLLKKIFLKTKPTLISQYIKHREDYNRSPAMI